MHPYGHTRFASKSCEYGCCGVLEGVGLLKHCKSRVQVDRAARKRARQHDKKMIEESKDS